MEGQTKKQSKGLETTQILKTRPAACSLNFTELIIDETSILQVLIGLRSLTV